jgi:ZIP family zinc transporter
MLASTMLPEAARDGGPVIGLLTAAGFLAAVMLDRL